MCGYPNFARLLLVVVIISGCTEFRAPMDPESMQLPEVPSGNEELELISFLQDLHDAVVQNPTEDQTRGRLAMAYDVNGFSERAITVYGQAASLARGEFNWPYFQALLVARVNNDYVRALELLGDAIEIDDSYVPAWLSRGAWLRELDRMEEARTAYERATELGAGAPAAVGIAHLYLNDSEFEQAKNLLESLVETVPDPRIDALLARAYRALGRDEDARIASARGSLATSAMQWMDPKLSIQAEYIAGFSNRLLHAQNLIQVGRQNVALPVAEALFLERPEDIAVINTLVWANAALERFEEAKLILRDGLGLYPDEPRFHQLMANVYLQEGDQDNGRHHLERVTELDAGNARALEDLGWLIARQGETAAGISLLEKALESGAKEPKQVLYRLGLLDGGAGRWSEAADRFSDATRIDASFTMAYVHLGRCLAEQGKWVEAAVALDWADRVGSHRRERASARRRFNDLKNGLP